MWDFEKENGDGSEDGNDGNEDGLDGNGKQVRCYFAGTKDENGTTKVDFWFDTHTDRFVPYN